MSLDIQELKEAIIGSFVEPETQEVAQGQFANTTREYILDNAIITGVYTGVLASGSPDPLGMPTAYTWEFESMEGMAAGIGDDIGSLSDWETKLKEALETLTVKAGENSATPPVVELTVPPPSITLTAFSIGDMSQITTFDNAIEHIAEVIINGMLTAVIAEPAAASSSAQGTGTVVYGSIS